MRDQVDFALRLVRPALLLAPATFLDETARWLQEHGIQRAVADHDTAAIFDWIVSVLGFQGIGDAAATAFAARQAPVTWQLVDEELRAGPSCPRLRSYWHFNGCGYRKSALNCAEPDHVADCFLPQLPLRKGFLNQAAVSLYLFLRDVCAGDFISWIDARLTAADHGLHALSRGRTLSAAVLDPLCNITGTGPKIWSMILADLLLAGDPRRERWVTAGAAMISIDSLIHNFFARTGVLRRLDAEHRYGDACHAPGGCADVVAMIAQRIDAREFNPSFPVFFPRYIEKSVWWFCAEAGRDICSGRRIDDRIGCRQVFCPSFVSCERLLLTR